MDLERYLHALENCPDRFVTSKGKRKLHRLTTELGVRDNFPILLRTDFNDFVQHLLSSDYRMGNQHDEGERLKRSIERNFLFCDELIKKFRRVEGESLNSITQRLVLQNYGIDLKDGERKVNYQMFYNPGTVELQVINYIATRCVTNGYGRESDIEKKHNRQQMKNFTISILVHDYQEKKMTGISSERALARAIKEIGEYALRERIPLCFPQSIEENNLKDCSQIVYYYPEERE